MQGPAASIKPEDASQGTHEKTETVASRLAGSGLSLALKASACEFKPCPIHFHERLAVVFRKARKFCFVNRIIAKTFLRFAVCVQHSQELLKFRGIHAAVSSRALFRARRLAIADRARRVC